MPTTEPDRLHIISFSGGKDSVATWLHLSRELGVRNIQCVFADTGHESPLTYEYLDYLFSQGCPLTHIQARCRDLRALGRMVESLGRISGADWRETDLWQSEESTVLAVTRTARNDDDAQAAETLIESIMCDIKHEVERASRWRLSYETKLETERD